MRCSSTGEQYNSQDRYRVIIHDTTMVKLLHSGAAMTIEGPVTLLLLLALWPSLVYGAGIMAENYSAATGTAVETQSGSDVASASSTKDDGAAGSTIIDYWKGYGVGMNGFGQHQRDFSIEYQTDYGNTQSRYGTSDSGSNEQESHISAGYHHPLPGTYSASAASAYEVVPHGSEMNKFVENSFSHQYEEESAGGPSGGGGSGGGGGYHSSASGNEGSSPDYHQSHGGYTASQHHHTDVINYVPYPVVKKLHVPYAKPVQIPISHAVIIPVRKPVPIHIPITKQIQVPVEKELKIPVERLVPYPVERQVPVPVEKRVPYPVVKYMTVKVPKPYAVKVPVVKTVVHKIKQWW